MQFPRKTAALIAVLAILAACQAGSPSSEPSASEAAVSAAPSVAAMPDELVIGFVPSTEAGTWSRTSSHWPTT